jgi:molybdate transport system substrate-binding protein
LKKLGALVAAAALLITGCGSSSGGSESKTLTVFAAASLTESFQAMKTAFESAHPGTEVRFNFAGSSSLVQQLSNGAEADVFASADETNMDKAVQAGVIDGSPSLFATNKLTIAVAPGDPKGITSFADLVRDGLNVVVCAPQVPCGSATKKVEQNTGVTLKPVSEEQDVKQVLNKVQSGDADAGLVYLTDAASAAGKVAQVDFPEAATAVNHYPIAVVKDAPRTDLAKQWIEFVLGEQGKAELQRVGFGAP